MITVTDNFTDGIKADTVRLKVKVVIDYVTPLTITNKDIIDISVTQKADIAVGALQDDKIVIRALTDSFNDAQYGQFVTASISFGIGTDFCNIGKYSIVRWAKDNYITTIELGSLVPSGDEITEIGAKNNITLIEYIKEMTNKLLGVTPNIGAITDTTYNSPIYLYYKTIKEQMNSFAFASQALCRSSSESLEFVPYKFSMPTETYKEESKELILDKGDKTEDLVLTKENYVLCKSKFSKEEFTTLASLSDFYATADYPIAKFSFSSPSIVSYLDFKKYGYFYDLKVGIWGGSINIGSGYVDEDSKVNVSIVGTRIISIPLIKSAANVTYLSNPYISNDDQLKNISLDVYKGNKYSFSTRINPATQVGDTIIVEGIGTLLVTGMSYTFDGSLTGTIEGVLKDATN